MTTHHVPGTSVLLREVCRGKVWTLRPVTVVVDTPDLVALYLRDGAIWRGAVTLAGETLRVPWEEWTLSDPKPWMNHMLSLSVPGEPYSISLIWHESWYLYGWYINIEEPLRRSEFGFDYMDWTLDVMVSRDRKFHKLKDEDELEEGVRRGVYTTEHAAQIHEAAERGLDHLLSWRAPFDCEWENWRPDPAWPVAVLPERWE